jgi:hypothetical protein
VTPTAVASPLTSTLNFPVGDDRANGVSVALGPGGTLSAVYQGASGASTDVVFDVTGYYLADLAGARFVPVAPGRVLDTRYSTGLNGPFLSGSPRVLYITPGAGVPADASALTGNLTVVQPTSGGWVTMTAQPTVDTPTSSVNLPAADTRANGVTGPLTTSGTVGLTFVGGGGARSNVILDVTGYFR